MIIKVGSIGMTIMALVDVTAEMIIMFAMAVIFVMAERAVMIMLMSLCLCALTVLLIHPSSHASKVEMKCVMI